MSYVVTIEYDPTWKALAWAKKHCPSYITNDVHSYRKYGGPVDVDYFFYNEADAIWFKLMWS